MKLAKLSCLTLLGRGISTLTLPERRVALSAQSLRNLASSLPDSLAIALGNERISKLEFSEMVNALAQRLSQLPKSSTFLPVVVGTNISSVILYHAAILSRTPVALIDGNINQVYLEKILSKLAKPRHVVITAPEFSSLLTPEIEQIHIERDRQTDFEIPDVDMNEGAIVIFSSGSTGEPKGVIWSWQNVDDSFSVISNFYSDGRELRLGRVTSIAYAAGAYQMFSAVLNHNLHLINPTSTPNEIIDFVNQNKLQRLAFSSSFAERIYEQRDRGLFFDEIEEINTYGESVSWEQIKKFRELTQGKALIRTSYGASESPGFVVYLLVKPETPLGVGPVPIGYVTEVKNVEFIPNPEDPEIKSLAINNFTALGYLDDADLTSKKFQINEHGERCYHTGDLVRIGENGAISFVGRGDDLVKINGRLVGPGESEALLRVFPGVANVAVLPHVTPSGKNYLTAHLVVDPESSVTPTEIYEYLISNLASHLIPAQLVRHRELPLNANNKVDRKALQSKQWPRWRDDDSAEAPTTLERFVLSQLRRILNTPDLSPTEDIFGSGMDSLAALEFEAVASEFGYENIKPAIFLEHRTVHSIAGFLATGRPAQESNFVTLNGKGSSTPYFLLPGAGVSAIFFKEFADELGTNQPLIVIEPRGMHTAEPIEESLEEMARSTSSEINSRQPEGELLLIGHSAGSAIACETGVLLTAMGRRVRMISLDATGLTNRVAMPPHFFRWHARYQRLIDLITRSPQRTLKSIQRRQRATNKGSYEFFTIHIGTLTIRYELKVKPTFPIHFLYCVGKRNTRFWQDGELFTFEEIQGKHFTMLNHEYLPDVTKKIRTYFSN